MKFEKEMLFKELVAKYGLNLFLGAGFSVYSYNENDESLPLGNAINQKLIEYFDLDVSKKFNLNQTCQKIKKINEGDLQRFLKEKYRVKKFDDEYLTITKLPVKNIFTTNIDNLLEKVYESEGSFSSISDSKIYGSLEKTNVVNLYKLHGSVTYPIESVLSFTEKELTDLFIRDPKMFEAVSYKISVAPTIFWGTKLSDNNILQILCNAESHGKSNLPLWIVVYPNDSSSDYIEELKELGFNIIEADTKDLLNYLENQEYKKEPASKKNIYAKYRELFPLNFICKELKRSGVRRPVVDYFSGAEPQISDIMSNNVCRTNYFETALDTILSGEITLITGIPGCGKSTLLMQLAFSENLTGSKFWFNNIITQEAERLVKAIEHDTNRVIVFIDNLYYNIDALQILRKSKKIKLVIAERALNYEYVKRFLNISAARILDISNLEVNDIQNICKLMNRPSSEAIDLIHSNTNISLLEIVFYVSTKILIRERIKQYIKDLKDFKDYDSELKIDLLELFTLINYTSYCGIPCSMDMMIFYFSDSIDSYEDIFYALKKMDQIIVESTEIAEYEKDQNYVTMRSKLFSEKTLELINKDMIVKVLNQFSENISNRTVYRYDIFKRRAYDADITNRAFSYEQGKDFYNKILKNNQSPYVRQQYALFLQRKNDYTAAWEQIDQAYTDSNKKIFSIANTHAIIMFEKNIDGVNINTKTEDNLLKNTIKKSFDTLKYCITVDVRINYHVLTYARNAIRYYEKFGLDDYSKEYVDVAFSQINIILSSKEREYIVPGIFNELINLKKEFEKIKNFSQ